MVRTPILSLRDFNMKDNLNLVFNGFFVLMMFFTASVCSSSNCSFQVLNGSCSLTNDCKNESVHFLNPDEYWNCTNFSNVTHICRYTNYTPQVELGVKVPGPYDVIYYRIPDKNMNASSNRQNASRARIGMKLIDKSQAAWCAALNDSDKWLEVNFDMPVDIEKIEVEGLPKEPNRWVERFYLRYIDSSGNEVWYNKKSIFNSSQNGSCHYVFINQTTKLRIYSESNPNKTCLRLAIYGKLSAVTPIPVAPVEPTDKYKNLDSASITTDDFLKGYLLWAIFIAFLVFLVIFTLTLLFCWCCRRAKPLKSAMEKSKEANPYYVPAWRRIDEKAEKGYIATQETQEVKIAFTDEYIPPGLQKEKQDPNDDKFYRQRIFSFSRDQREDTKTSQQEPKTTEENEATVKY